MLARRCLHSSPETTPALTPSAVFSFFTSSVFIWLVALFALVCTPLAQAEGGGTTLPKFTETRLVEWDISTLVDGQDAIDGRPGAIIVDIQSSGGSKVWFVTRDGATPRVFRFQPSRNLKHDSARWDSWTLSQFGLGPTGGLKKLKSSYDRRFIFVRTALAVQKIDTLSNQVTVYRDNTDDEMSLVSDVAIDNRNNVYSTASGSLHRLNANANSCAVQPCAPVEGTRWHLASSAGICQSAPATDPCIAGVAVHPKYQNLVYVAESEDNTIAEVDTSSKSCWACANPQSKVRRWNLGAVGASQPRQINIDKDGTVWIITGGVAGGTTSGGQVHLVSLDPKTNKVAAFEIPTAVNQDTFGVAPDGGMVGYTANSESGPTMRPEHKVAMLVPRAKGKFVSPLSVWVNRETKPVEAICDAAMKNSGQTPPHEKKVHTRITSKSDGTFVEALINQSTNAADAHGESRVPLGITPDWERSVGTFFYAVGQVFGDIFAPPTVNRIGLARLPRDGHKAGKDRDDEDCDDDGKKRGHDDDDDDDGKKNELDEDDDGDSILDWLDDDDDNDGIKNQHDRKDSKETQDNRTSELGAGEIDEIEVTSGSRTLAFIATASSSDPLSPISLEIVNPAGAVIASAMPAPGAATVVALAPPAGDYKVRVRNHGLNGAAVATGVITRDALEVTDSLLP